MAAKITKAAVIGSGVMGASIAAHLANVGVSTLLLDIVPAALTPAEAEKGLTLEQPAVRNRLAKDALSKLIKQKPSPLYEDSFVSRIIPGNIEDHLSQIQNVNWVIEVIVESLSVKQALLCKLEQYWKPGIIVSSNTSGISINEMVEGCGADFKTYFLGTHFFNPPRYMKLMELIPGKSTKPEVVQQIVEFCEKTLGKGVVIAKDTPNFIANRIGTYGLLVTLQAMIDKGFSVEEIDAVTGPAMGRPKSATFRTLDLVGLDTFVHVANNVFEKVDHSAEKMVFEPPQVLRDMVAHGWIGEKAGQGFYKKVKGELGSSEILSLNLTSMEYVKSKKISSASIEAAKSAKGASNKLKAMLSAKDRYSELAWDIVKKTLVYSAEKVGEQADSVADSILDIDKAMKWGFNWELGPFELWDAISLKKSVERMESEGEVVPKWVKEWLAEGNSSFYKKENGSSFYVNEGRYREVEQDPEIISLTRLKEQNKLIRGNSGASLIDVGSGVACLEFHSSNNAIGSDILMMIQQSVEEVRRNYDALIIANEGRHFCVGANIMLLLMEAQNEEWDEVDQIIRMFQSTMMKLKYLEKPVVAAPHHMTLGGGVEVCLPADEVCAYAESYYGLVEVGVGLIPAGGGCKEIALRINQMNPNPEVDLQPYINEMFMNIGMAKVSTSAHDAKRLGYFRPQDRVIANQDYLIHEAKLSALRMVQAGYEPTRPEKIRVVGADGKAILKLGALSMKQSGYISEHDFLIAGKLAHVLAGGDLPAGTMVTEQYMLDLEREAFLSLCGERKTQERMQYMLSRGKALRN